MVDNVEGKSTEEFMQEAITELMGSEEVKEPVQEQLPPETDEPEEEAKAEPEGDSEEDLEFGDMPNGKIRYDKLKEKVAKLEGMIELLTKQKEEPKEEQEPEYLSDEEIRERDRDIQIQELKAELDAIKKEKITRELQEKDDAFYKANPHLAKDRIANNKKMLAYIRSKPGMMKDLYDGVTSLQEVYQAMGGKPAPEVQDPTKVFGSSKQTPMPGRTVPKEKDTMAEANSILSDPNSTNKADAVNMIESSLVDVMLHL